jgi:hypothetical protein
MPLWIEPPSGMPKDRTPTPEELIQEATRRYLYDPRSHAIAVMVEQIVASVRGHGPSDRELFQHLRMGAVLALVVNEHADEIQERAAGTDPPAWVTDRLQMTRADAERVFGDLL